MKASQRILKAILSGGAMSRMQLSKRLGISASSVSEAVAELIEKGMLVEIGYGKGLAKGRKNILLDIDISFSFALGVGILSSTLCVGIATVKGQTLAKRVLTISESDSPNNVCGKAKSAIIEVMKDCCLDKSKIIGIGICLTARQAQDLRVDERFLSELGINTVIEPADEYIEYSGAYMPINPEEMYIFGCAKVVREMYV